MPVEQAIFTSLVRDGRAGYHLVARSRGIDDADAQVLTSWCPSHGALLLNAANNCSVNFHSMPHGRFALSRTREGPPEYSGRGGRQVYTHILVLTRDELVIADWQPFALYRDALARGTMRVRLSPPSELPPIELGRTYPRRGVRDPEALASSVPIDQVGCWCDDLVAGRSVLVHHEGDRVRLFEALVGLLPAEAVTSLSFTTSLRSSVVRPYRLGPASP